PIFCLRYIDWCFSTSLLLLDLALMRGADMKATAVLMGIDVAGELFALMAALSTPDRGKWQYFSLGMLFFGAMVTFLFTVLQRAAEELGGAEQKKFKFVASRTIEVWCLYPVVFTLAEMTNSISQEMEVLGYAILDAIAKSGIPLIIWIWSISEQRASRSKLLTIPENEEYVDA
ncbi:sop2, partial [Symbiodinium pilosum]